MAVVVGGQKLIGTFVQLWNNLGRGVEVIKGFLTGGISGLVSAFKRVSAESAAEGKKIQDNATQTAEKLLSAFNTTSGGIISGTKNMAAALANWSKAHTKAAKTIGDELTDIDNKYKLLAMQMEINNKTGVLTAAQQIKLLEDQNKELAQLSDEDGKVKMKIVANQLEIVKVKEAAIKQDEADQLAHEKFNGRSGRRKNRGEAESY